MSTIDRPALDAWIQTAVVLTDDVSNAFKTGPRAARANAPKRESAFERRLRLIAFDLRLDLPEGCIKADEDCISITLTTKGADRLLRQLEDLNDRLPAVPKPTSGPDQGRLF